MSPAEAAELAAIDWDRPWLEPYRSCGRRLARSLAAGATVAEALTTELAAAPLARDARPLCFVPQSDLPAGTAYEAHIAATGRVPTRNNRHDLFNGLVWLTSPRLKRRLNRLQAEHLRTEGIGPTRGAARDTLTLFDENAAWLQGPPALTEALRRRDWPVLFQHHRAAWGGARLRLFGHALLDKLTQPRTAITAHVWLVPGAPDGEVGDAEDWLAGHLSDHGCGDAAAGRRHHPLPVLGVPGWWAANAEPAFYDDRTVFRPPGAGRPLASAP